jgi:hypothetical protein
VGKRDDPEIVDVIFRIVKVLATPKNNFYLLPSDYENVTQIAQKYY